MVMAQKTVLVTGANGFIGFAVCKAFCFAGWKVFGQIRSDRSAQNFLQEEITPIVTPTQDTYASFAATLPAIDVIVTCCEDLVDYDAHHRRRLAMIREVCRASRADRGEKPLVIFSSGCKDYGMGLRHGQVGLAPHTEESPLNPPPLLVPRTAAAQQMFGFDDEFDCIVVRPTTLFGRSSSYYSYIFAMAEQAKTEHEGVLTLPEKPDSILHGTHIDDCAAAYLTLATSPRKVVAGQAYNISSHRYETLGEIALAIQKSHGIQVKFRDPDSRDAELYGVFVLSVFNFPQWVGSDKLRKDTGWTDKKPLFHEAYETYRRAYEAAAGHNTEQVQRVMDKSKGMFTSGVS
jgi:nucleoside-diphosphate-sugar epimerase